MWWNQTWNHMNEMSVLLFIFENPVSKAFLKGWNLGCRYFKLDTDVNEFNKFDKVVKVNLSLKLFWEKDWSKVQHPKWPHIHSACHFIIADIWGPSTKCRGYHGSQGCSCSANSFPDFGHQVILPGSVVKTIELTSPEENQILHDVLEDKMHEIIGKEIREK